MIQVETNPYYNESRWFEKLLLLGPGLCGFPLLNQSEFMGAVYTVSPTSRE